MDFTDINNILTEYYNELFTNEYLLKYGYYSYKKKSNPKIEDYPNSDIFYHKLFNFDDFLSKIRVNSLVIQNDVWTEPTYFNIPKSNLLRRQYKLPNIYSYLKLSSFLVTNKRRFIEEFLENRQSTSKYFDSNVLTFSKQKGIEAQLLFGGKYRLYTDLSNFYSTLYTHSIPWMILGKWNSKRTFQRNQNAFENKLDKLIQISQYGETHGIPTGNLVSRIIAEFYMCCFDRKMFDKGFIYKRYVDDFIFAFNSEDEKDDFLEKMNLICRENNLYLNNEKTKIEAFPYKDPNDKVDVFNYLTNHGLYLKSNDLDKKKKIIIDYISFCEKCENEGNKGCLKTIFSGLDIAFKEFSEQEIAAILLGNDHLTGYNILKRLIDISFCKPELSNRLLSLLDTHLNSNKSEIKSIFTEYFDDHILKFKNQTHYYHNNKFDLELYQVLLYIVLFVDQPVLNIDELLNMIDVDVDDYSLCLTTIIYLQNNYDYNQLLDKVNNLLMRTHQFYEPDRARMTEKLWFFRYFIYLIIKNIPSLSQLVRSNYRNSELDWSFICTQGTNQQPRVTNIYQIMLDRNVTLVNCGTNFNFEY